ncbi:hypothetical protein PCE1_002473 [Barthelona sp. PCE]
MLNNPNIFFITHCVIPVLFFGIFGALLIKSGNGPLKNPIIKALTKIGIGPKKRAKFLVEVGRKGIHVVLVVIPVLFEYLHRTEVLSKRQISIFVTFGIILTPTTEICRYFIKPLQKFMNSSSVYRPDEKVFKRPVSGLFFCFGSVLSLIFFPILVSFIAMLHVCLGDLFAALVGYSIGKTKIKGSKTLEGSMGCFVTCFFSAFIFAITASFDIRSAFLISFFSSLFATLAELYSFYEDNIDIPVWSGIGSMVALQLPAVVLPTQSIIAPVKIMKLLFKPLSIL